MKILKIGIIGNPKCGKSTILSQLIKSSQMIHDNSTLIIEKQPQTLEYKNTRIQITDLPGVYSLGVGGKYSIDQTIVINYLHESKFNFLINVIDSTNLRNNLYLTVQLLERKISMVLLFNMNDVAKKKGIIDQDKLSTILKLPILSISSKKEKDIKKLKEFLINNKNTQNSIEILNFYPKKIKRHYLHLSYFLNNQINYLSHHKILITLLEGSNPNYYKDDIRKYIKRIQNNIEKDFQQECGSVLINCRYSLIDVISKKIINKKYMNDISLSDKIDNIILNRFLAIPIFFCILYIVFVCSINIGGIFQELFSLIGELILIDLPLLIASKLYLTDWIVIFIRGLGGSIQAILSLTPVIALMYFSLLLLEDSGYTMRAATIAHKPMRLLGLSGQSFMPLTVGLGCNVPAISATRTSTNKKQKILTIMMIPFISCTGRLAVYTLFCYIFFPFYTQNIIFALYCIGVLTAIFTSLLLKTKSSKRSDGFYPISKLPKYKIPKFNKIIQSSLLKTISFMYSSGKIILIAFFIIYSLHYVKVSMKDNHNEYIKKPITHVIGQALTPIFQPLGLKEENWPAAVAMITGIFAKEVIVGTLLSLYSNESSHSGTINDFNFLLKYKEGFSIILSKTTNILVDNFFILYSNSYENYQEQYHVDSTLSYKLRQNISDNFNNKITVLSYLIFILLYFPCISVFGAISSEAGNKWAIISALWSTSCAYSISIIFYQTVNYILNNSINYYYLLLGVLVLTITSLCLRYYYFFNYSSKVTVSANKNLK